MTVTGRLVFVDVGVQPVTQQVRIWAEVVNDNLLLKAGVVARMEISPPVERPAASGGT